VATLALRSGVTQIGAFPQNLLGLLLMLLLLALAIVAAAADI
jgi:hypothetical protein